MLMCPMCDWPTTFDSGTNYPPGFDLDVELDQIRRHCLVCQASHPPNWQVKQPLAMTPIPPRVMFSVSLDLFSMPEVEWEGTSYDAFLLCVDRHSGWMVAKPTRKEGLTGRKAATLMLESSWGEMGVPGIITSDQGSQFIAQWWDTMCSRLGIRAAFSQAHRPQANGRAEVAGRVLIDLLRAIGLDNDLTWVEAMPRALRIHHDMIDPITGLSPYQIMFGRERSLGGLPGELETECREAVEYFERMAEIDRTVAQKLKAAHDKVAAQVNRTRKKRPPYSIGEWVWISRPKPIGGMKLETWWRGPFRVLRRVGDASYVVRLLPRGELEVHADQMKPCVWEELGEPTTELPDPTPGHGEKPE